MDKNRMQDAGSKMQECVSLIATPVKRRINPGFAESRIPNPESLSGFTLVEMIMVIVITGIIGSMVAVFLKRPIQQYMDVSRRAELTDIADTALRRISRDVRTAVPNSVRASVCANNCVEFLPTRDGGRYRADSTGNVLTFGTGGSSIFDIVGTGINFLAGDYIVVGSAYSDSKPPYDQSASGVLRAYTGAAGVKITVNFAAPTLPGSAQLLSQRFDVVDGTQQAVTYACTGTAGTDSSGNGTMRLMRYWLYNFNPTQIYPPGGQSATLAKNVSFCNIEYNLTDQRLGLLAVTLTLTSGGESVTLYNETHVNNAP